MGQYAENGESGHRSVQHLESIDLVALDASAAHLRRFDAKFLLTGERVEEFTASLGNEWLVLEVGGSRCITYRSQYYDDALRCFSDHVKERRRRFKVRVRQYLPQTDTILEVKLKTGRGLTDKYRMPRPPSATERLLPDEHAWINDCLARAGIDTILSGLAPTACVSYERTTLLHPGSGERVTIDRNLAASVGTTSVLLLPGACVLEVKAATARGVSTRLVLDRFRSRPASFSKYCAAIGALHPDCDHRMLAEARRTVARQLPQVS